MLSTVIFIFIQIILYSMRYDVIQQAKQLSPYYRTRFFYLNNDNINSLKYNEYLSLFIIFINLYLSIFKIVSTSILYNPCFYILCVILIYCLITISKLLEEIRQHK